MTFPLGILRVRLCARACLALSGALVLGCASFQLPPYPQVVQNVAERTLAIEQKHSPAVSLNRAARLNGRSQAEIKSQLEKFWNPSLRFRAWANYNGLIATRQSQFVTQPGPQFR